MSLAVGMVTGGWSENDLEKALALVKDHHATFHEASQAYPCTVPGWSEYLGIWNTLTGGCSVHAPVHVLSRDGQSILGSDRGECSVDVPVHVLSRDGQSISGYSDHR